MNASQIKKEIEIISFRIESLQAIELRRDRSIEETEELENLSIRRSTLQDLLSKSTSILRKRFEKYGKAVTFISAIVFVGLALYTGNKLFTVHTSSTSEMFAMSMTSGVTAFIAAGLGYIGVQQIETVETA